MAGRVILLIRLAFDDPTNQQAARKRPHQEPADEIGGHDR
jgi:hypothetical protein